VQNGALRVRGWWLTGWHFVAGKTWTLAITGLVVLLPLQLGVAFDQPPPPVMPM
jgi:hypothetical protein